MRTHLEAPRLLLEVLKAAHARDGREELLHLLAEAHVEAVEVRKARDAQVEVQHVVLVRAEQLAQERRLARTAQGTYKEAKVEHEHRDVGAVCRCVCRAPSRRSSRRRAR